MANDLIAHYGAALVFINVLASALGVPVPAMPTLILVGASIEMSSAPVVPQLMHVLTVSVCGSLLGDSAWFLAGKRYGGRTLRALCRLSLSRDTCVKQTERFFGRWGVQVLSVAKFIPGLSLVAVPLAGAMGVRLAPFLRYDSLGAALWATTGLAAGAIFAPQLDTLFTMLGQLGRQSIGILMFAFGAYVAYRWWRRRSLLKVLSAARISVNELYGLMQAEVVPVIFDIRSREKRLLDPFVIPGAQFADERQLDEIVAGYEPHRKVVIYCSCPNDVSAAWMAKRLRELGFTDVKPLSGGLDAWRLAGWELMPMVENAASGAQIGIAARAPASDAPVSASAAVASASTGQDREEGGKS
jgi:membrane protein DedA with SNARE-associated domain/rhodanese-related sulfurtransferase